MMLVLEAAGPSLAAIRERGAAVFAAFESAYVAHGADAHPAAWLTLLAGRKLWQLYPPGRHPLAQHTARVICLLWSALSGCPTRSMPQQSQMTSSTVRLLIDAGRILEICFMCLLYGLIPRLTLVQWWLVWGGGSEEHYTHSM